MSSNVMFFRANLTNGQELIFMANSFVRAERKGRTYLLLLQEGAGAIKTYAITEETYNTLFRSKTSHFVCWE